MGDILGFKKHDRKTPAHENVKNRLQHFREFIETPEKTQIEEQSSRCMDCGVPFCHSKCPLGNRIPEFNDAVYQDNWELAYDILSSTNNFPEFTGRICPAPCESACVLGINNDPVAIEFVEKSIIEMAFEKNWIRPNREIKRTGKKVAIVGSGPAGLAAADQLNKAGHEVVVYEKNTHPGGLLRFGIPDFKLEKSIIDRRLTLMKEEGVTFECNVEVGKDIRANTLKEKFDSLLLCGGSSVPRDLKIKGRDLKGIYFAMDFLEKNNKRVAGHQIDFSEFDLSGKDVVVIGGGDTGSDCIGTSNRLGARSVTQIEILSKPALQRTEQDPWPNWPMILRTSSSHKEGCEREWALTTTEFISNDGINLSGIEVSEVEWKLDPHNHLKMVKKPQTEKIIPCDYVFLAMGFLHPFLEGITKDLSLTLDKRKNISCTHYQTSVPGVFAAGDMRRGQSLVVWAIAEGREAALSIDHYLMGNNAILKSNFSHPLAM